MAACGISLSPFSGIPYQDFAQLAREAEEAGFSGVFVPEANNDALMCCHAIAAATRRVTIATWIVNIYLRQPTLCAAGAAMVQEAAGGRFVLGLGVSHRPALQALHIEMSLAGHPVKVSTVYPGGTETAFVRNMTATERLGDVDLVKNFDKRPWSTSPQKAAQVILKGVRKNRVRILIGPDTKLFDVLARITGPRYQRVVPKMLGRWLMPPIS